MKRILLLLWVLGLAVLPLSAQTLKKTFTGTLECMRYIPAYEDGKVFYVNPHAGGQSGNLVVLKEADGQYRIWDNDSRMWFSESIEDCKSLFFINVDMVFVAKKSDRCRVMYTGMLDGLKLEDRNMMFTDWRYKLNEQRQIEYLVLALGQKWGVMGPDGNFLVPTRYDSPEEALSALKKRKEAEKPLGMSDMAFMASQIHDITHRDEMFDGAVHLDWQWYDPVNGTLYYTLEELPWCGPYIKFTGNYDYEPVELEEGSRYVIWNIFVGVEDDVLSFIPDLGGFSGPVLPLSTMVSASLYYDLRPVRDAPGDLFYGEWEERYGYTWRGIRINRDNSFQLGYFGAYDEPDGSLDIHRFSCISRTWDYKEFFRHYVTSARNKGEDPSEQDVVQAYRDQLEKNYLYKLYFDHFHIWNTYDRDGTITVFVDPQLEVKIPVSKAQAATAARDYDKHSGDMDYYKVEILRKVSDSGEAYVDYLWISSPGGTRLEYVHEEDPDQTAE